MYETDGGGTNIHAFFGTKRFQSLIMHGQNDTKVIFVRYVYV